MRQNIFSLLFTVILITSCTQNNTKTSNMNNPLLSEFTALFGAPPFETITPEHYIPAFIESMKQQKSIVNNIVNNSDIATFENTIEEYENSDSLLNKIGRVFYNLASAETNNQLKEISKELSPLISNHNDDIKLNIELFKKIKTVFDKKNKLNLNTEELTLLNKTYQSFVRGGANLDSDKRERFREINKKVSLLYLQFGDNILEENNKFKLIIDNETDLNGLSEASINAAAQLATSSGHKGKWIFTIHKPSLLPFLENSTNRALRKKMYTAYIMKCDNNDSLDNKVNINKIINLRTERAILLGFNNHAEYILDKNMAKEPKNVYNLLDKLMPAALKVANIEVTDMQKLIKADGDDFKLEAWDYPYYSAKVKENKYALNESDIRPYLQLKNVRDGMFWVANQLYDITFTKLTDMPIYQKDVEVFEVKESNGNHIGILYMDYYPRSSKRSGAWCASYRTAKYKNGERIAPIMSIVCNFSAPIGDTPALLSVDETETLFHEFGHGLDGLFSKKHYASLHTPRDFVELPSQIMENWAFAPEVLNHYAKHYKTGEPMPTTLIDKIKKAGKFNQGFATTEYLAASYLDMDYHTLNKSIALDVNAFEKQSMNKINLISEIDPRYRSTYFQHIFSGESYSAGYYSYVWAEVLDADAFEAFKQNGIFDKTTAAAFRTNVLELGGTDDAMKLYTDFRGYEPNIQALINRRGLN